MKGRSPTAQEKKYMDMVCDHGCLVCRDLMGYGYSPCCPHHTDGKTKPEAHFKIIGLCGNHHQNGGEGVAIHFNKYQFEQNYGTEQDLLILQMRVLGVDIVGGKVIYLDEREKENR